MNYGDFQFLKFDPKPNGVLLMTLNRPEVMNATNGRLHWELTKILATTRSGPSQTAQISFSKDIGRFTLGTLYPSRAAIRAQRWPSEARELRNAADWPVGTSP